MKEKIHIFKFQLEDIKEKDLEKKLGSANNIKRDKRKFGLREIRRNPSVFEIHKN